MGCGASSDATKPTAKVFLRPTTPQFIQIDCQATSYNDQSFPASNDALLPDDNESSNHSGITFNHLGTGSTFFDESFGTKLSVFHVSKTDLLPLVNALSLIAERMDILAQNCVQSLPSREKLTLGMKYILKVAREKSWQQVELDDWLPVEVNKKHSPFGDTADNSIWLPMLLKAYVKAFSDKKYKPVDLNLKEAAGVYFGDASISVRTDDEKFREHLKDWIEAGDKLIGVVFKDDSGDADAPAAGHTTAETGETESTDESPLPTNPTHTGLDKSATYLGLASGKLYPIIDYIEQDDVKLVCLRNRWQSNFTGTWNAQSPLWKSETGKRLHARMPHHDNSFWMSLTDFRNIEDQVIDVVVPPKKERAATVLASNFDAADFIDMVVPSDEFPTIKDAISKAKSNLDANRKIRIKVKQHDETEPILIDRPHTYLTGIGKGKGKKKKPASIACPSVKIVASDTGIEGIAFSNANNDFVLTVDGCSTHLKEVNILGSVEICRCYFEGGENAGSGSSSVLSPGSNGSPATVHPSPQGANTNGSPVNVPTFPPVRLEACNIHDSSANGISITSHSNPLILQCQITQNHTGIVVQGQSHPQIEKTTISQNVEAGLVVKGQSTCTCTNNIITENQNIGLHVTESSTGAFVKNVFTGQNIKYAALIDFQSTPTLERNTFKDNAVAIKVSSANPLIKYNEVTSNATGIEVAEGAAPRVEGNNIHDNSQFALSAHGASPLVVDNEIGKHAKAPAIYLNDCRNMTVSTNRFSRCEARALVLENVSAVVFQKNTFSQCSKSEAVRIKSGCEFQFMENRFEENQGVCVLVEGGGEQQSSEGPPQQPPQQQPPSEQQAPQQVPQQASSPLTFTNNTFIKNSKSPCVHVQGGACPQFIANQFTQNDSHCILIDSSSGSYAENNFEKNTSCETIRVQGLDASPTLSKNTFQGNPGGALSCGLQSTPIVTHCDFINHAKNAAVIVEGAARPSMKNNNFSKNENSLIIRNASGSYSENEFSSHGKKGCVVTIEGKTASPELDSNQFKKNRCTAVCAFKNSTPQIMSNLFEQNVGALSVATKAAGQFTGNIVKHCSDVCVRFLSDASTCVKNNTFESSLDTCISLKDCTLVQVENNTFTQGKKVAVCVDNSNPTFKSNTFSQNTSAFLLQHASTGVYDTNEILDCTGPEAAVSVLDKANPSFVSNRLSNSARDALLIQACAGTYESNEIFSGRADGMAVKQGATPVVRNNKIYGNARYGISIESSSGEYSQNEIYQHTVAGVYVGGGAGAGKSAANNAADSTNCRPKMTENKIHDNKDGIFIDSGRGTFIGNHLFANSANAFLIVNDSSPQIMENKIYNNAQGIHVKNCAIIVNNDLHENEKDFLVE